MLDKYLDTT